MRKIKNYITRDVFLTKIYNEGVADFEELHHFACNINEPVRDFSLIVDLVKEAEKQGILYKKHTKSMKLSSYYKNLRWYMGRLERKGKIKGFTGVVGRPKGAKSLDRGLLESIQNLLGS